MGRCLARPMNIEAIGIRELRMRLKQPFETSFGSTQDRRILLVEVHSGGLTGYGEVTVGMGPYYNPETTGTAWHIFCDYLAPMVVGREISEPEETPALLEPIRGHEMTKAAFENAVWDIAAQQKNVSLVALLGGTRKEIPCGVSLGIKECVEDLLANVEREVQAGYQRIKIKIKPGKDVEIAAAIRKCFPDIKLMVDANSAYSLRDADHLRKFDDLSLMMIEQPLEWDEIFAHGKLQAHIATPICLDECIHNVRQTEAALDLRACRIINIKLGRVGGHTSARNIASFCAARSVPVWCGGMLESGVGRAHNIALSSLPAFTLPGDVSASQRYWDEDIIDPEVEVSSAGTITVPEKPGLGYRVRRDRVDALTVRSEMFRASARSVA
jgi:O-succinylbenzoate synthase